MRNIRLYYPQLKDKKVGNKLAIVDKSQLSRLKVIRADKVEYDYVLVDGDYTTANAELLQLTKEGALLKISRIVNIDPPKKNGILLFPVIKPQLIEEAVNAAVQFGIYSEIILYFSEYNRLSTNKFSDNKLERLGKIAESALLQSKTNILPTITLIESLDNLEPDKNNLFIVPDMVKEMYDPKILESKLNIEGIDTFIVAIGPEGGFGNEEKRFFGSIHEKFPDNIYRFSLGDFVLRSETASTAVSALIATSI